ncbi:MAG TPA: tRNA dimethylallyltransferase, partial [Bacteroidales bacterium]|nr:tRNA dimethylallyltransferase [Bacteroidales bacterium]
NGGLSDLQNQLKQLDPVCYHRIDLNNPKRVIRALEVCLSTGKPFSSFHTKKRKNRDFNVLLLGLTRDREELYQRIDTRIDQMLQAGLESEARKLYSCKGLVAMKTIGYREFFRFFDGELIKEEAIHLIRKNTRQYARKQINWLRRYDDLTWFSPKNVVDIISYIEKNR